MEPFEPDPSNSPPETWLGADADDSEPLSLLGELTVDQLQLGAGLDRAEGIQ